MDRAKLCFSRLFRGDGGEAGLKLGDLVDVSAGGTFQNGEGTLVIRLGVGILALQLVEPRQRLQRLGKPGIAGPECLLGGGERL